MVAFKLDENLPVEAAELLGQAGYDAATVVDQRMVGVDDTSLAHACKQEGRVMVTLDLDFADIRTFRPGTHPGIIVIRLIDQSKPRCLDAVKRIIVTPTSESIEGRLWIVDQRAIRIRGDNPQ